MSFLSGLACIEAISMNSGFATAGEVQKRVPFLTVGQVKRALNALQKDGLVVAEKVAYGRTGKWVYHLSSRCATNIVLLAGHVSHAYNVEA